MGSNVLTGKERLKPRTFGWLFKTTVLVHQVEIEIDHITNVGGLVEMERITVWVDTKAEWIMINPNKEKQL